MRILKNIIVSVALLAVALSSRAENPIPAEYKQGGFFIGCQAYTFRFFSAMEAIQKTAEAGGRVIEFYPGQKFSKEEPTLKWDHTASDEMIAKIKAKLDEYKVRAVNYGVVFGPESTPTEEEWRKVFEFAKKMNLYAITTESEETLDIIEKMVKEYDIRVGIHEHAKNPKKPDYKLWDPNYVLKLIENRDIRIGACADTGHWVRSGLNPVECLQILRGRVISTHMKDLKEFGKVSSHDVPFGTGVSDIPAILNELKDMAFDGNISVEYEYNWEHSVPEVAQCIGFVRGYGMGKNWE
ncbi:MAG: sugar phosphate isomerase/epimerase [Verrucomicrobia bacterium]|nr:sugar phosphate isomerase/epimerase [Verrucomicrobiota bacterium]